MIPFTELNGPKKDELTPLLLLLLSGSFCQAGVTGSSPSGYIVNCIFIMEKKYKLNFIKKKM